jgi:DNA-binding response OmpR family regulator
MGKKTQRPTILFVDDEPRWTTTYIEELETSGFNVVFKDNVDEAHQ